MIQYRSVSTGHLLERRPGQFFYRGRYFSGLVDIETNALYEDPEDCFAKHAGILSSLDLNLIAKEPE